MLLCFAVCLFASALLSERADRTVLSTAALFLVAGTVLGGGLLGVIRLAPDGESVGWIAEYTLFAVLFTDGMKVGAPDLRRAWRRPGRALLFGLPLTMAGTALAAHLVFGLDWQLALLVGAALSPTDPVLASAIVGRPEVPRELRHLLNVESGFNDGLALPVVVILLDASRNESWQVWTIALQLAGGVAIGIGIAAVAIRLVRFPVFGLTHQYSGLGLVSVGLMVLAVSSLTGANQFLAAFTAGITVATIGPEQRSEFEIFGERLTELLKLGALMMFGALISPDILGAFDWRGYAFAAVALFAVRPVALLVALIGDRMDTRQFLAAAWFGPKGFASVVYGLLIVNSGIRGGSTVFHLVALCVAASVVLHSSSDVAVSRWLSASLASAPAEPPSTAPDAATRH
ncbi:MAG: cation:proton antiporter [Ilumatobacteraceae bacterium]